MSSFIPMVSSSPPPMEDGGGFGWDDDDDDEEFGNFKAAPTTSVSDTWPQSENSSHEEYTGFAAFSTHNGEISPDQPTEDVCSPGKLTNQDKINEDIDSVKQNIKQELVTNNVVDSGIFSSNIHSPTNVNEESTEADNVDILHATVNDSVNSAVQNNDEETVKVENENCASNDTTSQVTNDELTHCAKDFDQNISELIDNSDIPESKPDVAKHAESSNSEAVSELHLKKENVSSDADIKLQCASLENIEGENHTEMDCETVKEGNVDSSENVPETSDEQDRVDDTHELNDCVNDGPDEIVGSEDSADNENISESKNTLEQNCDSISNVLNLELTEPCKPSDNDNVQDSCVIKSSENVEECCDSTDTTKYDLNPEQLTEEDDFGDFADISKIEPTVVQNTEALDSKTPDQGSVTDKEITIPENSDNVSSGKSDPSESVTQSGSESNLNDDFAEEDVQGNNSIHCEEATADKESEIVDDEFGDFGDFGVTSDKDWTTSEAAGGWSTCPRDENEAQDEVEETAWAGFSAPAFEESKLEIDNVEDESGDWAAFSEPQVKTEVDINKDVDEDWGSFGEESAVSVEDISVVSNVEQSPAPVLPPSQLQNMSKEEKLCYAVMTCFPCVITLNVQADSSQEEEEVDITDNAGLIWDHMKSEDEENSLTYQWTKSHWNSQLFTTLHIDTRNVLIGHKKAQVPVYAAGLSLLEPIKGQTPTLKPEPLVETSKSDLPATSQSTTIFVVQPTKNESIPAAQFDWNSSGLTNPLEANNKSLNLDFLIQDQNTKSNDLESEFMTPTDSAPTHIIQPLENLLAGLKGKPTFKQTNQERAMSKEAEKIVQSLPDLSFMNSKVLMFPVKM